MRDMEVKAPRLLPGLAKHRVSEWLETETETQTQTEMGMREWGRLLRCSTKCRLRRRRGITCPILFAILSVRLVHAFVG